MVFFGDKTVTRQRKMVKICYFYETPFRLPCKKHICQPSAAVSVPPIQAMAQEL